MTLKPSVILFPFSLIYQLIISLRNFLYDINFFSTYQSKIKTICVGNVIAGGSGKSPFVQYLAEELFKLNYQPVILLRGYKGSIKEPHLVSPADKISEVGDEALMHFIKLGHLAKIVTAKDRVQGVKFIEENILGNIIILDDGLQHRRLKAHCNLLLLDISSKESTDKWLSSLLLPAGYLRENLKQVLKRTDIVIYVNKTKDPYDKNLLNKFTLPSFVFELTSLKIVDTIRNQEIAFSELKDKNVLAVTAIAHPDSFFNSLKSLGLSNVKEITYPNHYQFTQDDFNKLISLSDGIICTEKDVVKLKEFFNTTNDKKLFTLSFLAEIKEENKKFFQILLP